MCWQTTLTLTLPLTHTPMAASRLVRWATATAPASVSPHRRAGPRQLAVADPLWFHPDHAMARCLATIDSSPRVSFSLDGGEPAAELDGTRRALRARMNACDPLFRATPPLGTRLQLGATAKEEEAVRAQLAHLLGRAINIEPEETGGTTRRRPTPRPTDAQAMAAATFTEHAVAAAASMTQRSRCLALPTGRHPRGRPQDRKGRAKSDTCMRVDSGRTVLQKVHSMPNLLRMRSC